MTDADCTNELAAQIQDAVAGRRPLTIAGSGSKAFLVPRGDGTRLDVRPHRGIVHYAPEELVLTVRAGTPLVEVEAALAERGQMLAFEPPHYGEGATIGGTLAAGLSGPRRAAAGSARDFVLGMRVVNGRGQVLRFGGEVIKNVAGYDVSRLMVGAFGTLGVMLEASFKVLPRPVCERTVVHAAPDAALAIKQLREWALTPQPISASAWHEGRLYLRLSGSEAAVRQAAAGPLGGEEVAEGVAFWHQLREQQLAFFDDARPLWRISVPPAATLLPDSLVAAKDRIVEWDGALRWVKTRAAVRDMFAAAAERGGHAMLYRNAASNARGRRQPLPPPLLALHKRVRAALDPHGIFNSGCLYTEL